MLNKLNNSKRTKSLIIYIILAAITFAVYWQVHQFDFINFDDDVYVTKNSHIQQGLTLEKVRWAFTTRYFGLWNPLVWISFMFDYQFHDLNAGSYHVTNLILHILSTLLLFWLFNRMTKSVWKSAFVAAFFALHPLHVESVAWVSERKDVLSAFFWMLTLCLYVYYAEKPALKSYMLVLFSFVFALMSKPMVITLPIIMILLDYWPLKRFDTKKGNILLWQLKEKIIFLILSVLIVIINMYPSDIPFAGKHFPLSDRLANAPVSFVIYLEKTFWPHNMAIFYPFPDNIPVWQVLGASLLIITISIAVIMMAKRLPYLFVGWLWYAATIIPVIKFVQVGNDAMADRYHYLTSIGLAVMMAWGIPSLIKSDNDRKKILFPIGVATLVTLALLSWQQCGYWRNSITLFSHATQAVKDNYLAHTNLAIALAQEKNYYKAIYHHNKAISIGSYCLIDYENRGKAYAALNMHKLAIDDFNKVISSHPNYTYAYYNRGTSYGKLGHYQFALDDFNKAIRLKPDYVEAYNNRGIVLDKLGLYQNAIDDFNKAIRIKPDYADAYNSRAFLYLNQGNTIAGCSNAKKACQLGNCQTSIWAKEKGLCR